MLKELKDRLELLKSTGTITEEANDISIKTLDQYVTEDSAEKYTMLITHLAMAYSRIERKEELSAPPEFVMKEVCASPHYEEAELRVSWIEKTINKELPREEKEFLLMHFVNVLS